MTIPPPFNDFSPRISLHFQRKIWEEDDRKMIRFGESVSSSFGKDVKLMGLQNEVKTLINLDQTALLPVRQTQTQTQQTVTLNWIKTWLRSAPIFLNLSVDRAG